MTYVLVLYYIVLHVMILTFISDGRHNKMKMKLYYKNNGSIVVK
jgi:hypothetical protein